MNRDISVDIVKGILMLLVVRIHAEGLSWTPYPVVAVPLFFFISGFFDKSVVSIIESLKKSAFSLLLPTIMWVIVGFVFHAVLSVVKNKDLALNAILDETHFTIGVMWFLVALFYAKAFYLLLAKMKLPIWLEIGITIILGWCGSVVEIPFLISEGFAALPLYCIGKHVYPYLSKIVSNYAMIACGIVCLCIIGLKWYPYILVPMGGNEYLYCLYLAIGLLSFIPFLWLGEKLKSQAWLASFGRRTLGILVIHPLLFHLCAVVLNRIMIVESASWYVAFACCYIIVCWLSYYLTGICEKYVPIMVGKQKL